jgi:hypothetical protein
MDHDQAACGELQLFNQFAIADACRMDMQGCGGAHGDASLWLESEASKQSVWFLVNTFCLVLDQ